MSLFTGVKGFEEYEKMAHKVKTKRIRYSKPTYFKFYSIYQYDRQKFREILNAQLSGETEPLSQKEILDKCYCRDEEGNLIPDSDQKHIFRFRTLENLHTRIYDYLGIDPFLRTYRLTFCGLFVYPDEQQAEIPNTWNMTIKERIILHIKLLRKIQKGLSEGKAIEEILNG
mgnify:CR=1 FL=1